LQIKTPNQIVYAELKNVLKKLDRSGPPTHYCVVDVGTSAINTSQWGVGQVTTQVLENAS
jgi:hypothetical protein